MIKNISLITFTDTSITKIYNVKSIYSKKFINKNFCIDNVKDIKKIKNIIYKFFKLKKDINTKNLYKFI